MKFADTQKEKDAKRLQQVTQNLWNVASANNIAALGPQYLAVSIVVIFLGILDLFLFFYKNIFVLEGAILFLNTYMCFFLEVRIFLLSVFI